MFQFKDSSEEDTSKEDVDGNEANEKNYDNEDEDSSEVNYINVNNFLFYCIKAMDQPGHVSRSLPYQHFSFYNPISMQIKILN